MKNQNRQQVLEDVIMNGVSKDNLLKHVQWFCENVSPRLSGTPACRQAAEYIVNTNRENGVKVECNEFMAYMSTPEKAEVKITQPEEKDIEAYAYAFTPPTPPKGLEGEVVAAGIGTEEDLCKVDIKGKICFVRYSGYKPITYNEKIRLAEERGAIAFLHQNWTPPEKNLFHYGSAKHVWGIPTLKELRDPTPESFAHIPALSTTRKGGDLIRDLLRCGRVWMRIRSQTQAKWDKLFEPIATVAGTVEPTIFIMVGGHFDAYGGGATDNAVGNALCLELARILQKYADRLGRSVRIGWWDGHETAKQSGSAWYVDNFWEDLQKNCITYINVDSPGTAAEKGITGPTMFFGSGAPIINQFCQDVARDLSKRTEMLYAENTSGDILIAPGKDYRVFKAGDQSFLGAGVPSAAIGTHYTPEFLDKIRTTYTSSLGWWYHSDDDTIDKIDIDALANATKAIAVFVARLCNLPVLPLKAEPVADWMIEGLEVHQQNSSDKLDLTQLMDKAKRLKKVAIQLDKAIDSLREECNEWGDSEIFSKEISEANKCLMKLSRILDPINYTLAGKYSQDKWGEWLQPIPGLREVSILTLKNTKSGEYYAALAGLVRERNKVSDAIEQAILLLENGTRKISK
jgi:hypothetical protein